MAGLQCHEGILNPLGVCHGYLELLSQIVTGWLKTTEMNFLTVLEARSPKSGLLGGNQAPVRLHSLRRRRGEPIPCPYQLSLAWGRTPPVAASVVALLSVCA